MIFVTGNCGPLESTASYTEDPSIEAARANDTQPWSVNDTCDTYSLGDIHLTHLQDKTIESHVSDMIVDMPAYARSPGK